MSGPWTDFRVRHGPLARLVPGSAPDPEEGEERMTASPPRPAGDPAFGSPRISDRVLAGHPRSTRMPAPHTAGEISALVTMLRAAGAIAIAIGHGRHTTSRDAVTALTEAWGRAGGTVLGTADWPAGAASWLKPARQLIRADPDAWVIADNPAGCAQLAMRLAQHEQWSAARTFGTASTDSPDLAALTGFGLLAGLRGVTADGRTWRIGPGGLFRYPASTPA